MPQSLSNVALHVVFSTKHRNPYLTPEIRAELFPYLGAVLKNFECPPIQIGGVDDHIHLLFLMARTVTIAQAVEKVKTSSSKWMKTKNPEFAWQAGYGVFSVGREDRDGAIRYIRNQDEHHRKLSFQDEYREMLRLAAVPFDEQYVWD